MGFISIISRATYAERRSSCHYKTYFQATMALPTGSSIQMQLRNGVISPRSRPSAVVPPSQPVLSGRVETVSRRDSIERDWRMLRLVWEHLPANIATVLCQGRSICPSSTDSFRCSVAIGARLTFSAEWSSMRWPDRRQLMPVLDLTTPKARSCQGQQSPRRFMRLREAVRETTARRGKAKPIQEHPVVLGAAVEAVALPDFNCCDDWSYNLAALMALVMADLSDSEREDSHEPHVPQRGVDLTALTVETVTWVPQRSVSMLSSQASIILGGHTRPDPRSFIAVSYGETGWVWRSLGFRMRNPGKDGFLEREGRVLALWQRSVLLGLLSPSKAGS